MGLLLIDLFGRSWFAYRPAVRAVAAMLGQSTSASGWNTFTVLGPLTLVVCVAGIAPPARNALLASDSPIGPSRAATRASVTAATHT